MIFLCNASWSRFFSSGWFEISTSFDIAIIGGGVIGLSLARELLTKGASVAIVDAALPGAASPAAAGMLAPTFEDGLMSEALFAFGAESLRQWPAFAASLEDETGCDIDFRTDGILATALEDEHAEQLRRDAVALGERGVNVSMLSGDEARECEPTLGVRVQFALEAPQDGQVDARKLIAALRSSCGAKGGIQTRAQVLSATADNGFWRLRLDRGDDVLAGRIVLACGAAAVTVKELPAPPIYPVKGDAFSLSMPEPRLRRVIRGPGAYLCPKAGGRLVVGASEAPHYDKIEVDQRAVDNLKRIAGAMAPFTSTLGESERWTGLRPATPDGAPVLGADPRGPDGVFLALGHYRNGILFAPASAKALAATILSGACETDLAAFAPDRFSDARPDG
ncbi:MAG: glycine oxidase ThiO [Pseudomonadota bacterium]